MGNVSLVVVVAFLVAFGTTESARILSIFPFQPKSHYITFEPLLKRLAQRGHQVVSVSHFPQKQKLANFTDVDISSTLPPLISGMKMSMINDFDIWKNSRYMLQNLGYKICHPVLNSPELKRILDSGDTFDVFFIEIFTSDCFLGIARRLKIERVIGAITGVPLPWANEIQRNPETPNYIPNWYSGYNDRMTFFERFSNAIILLALKIAYRTMSDRPSYEIAKRHFGEDLPTFDELRSNISLILVNAHHSISTPRPLVPGFKEIAGIHIPWTGPPPLSRDLREYLDSFSEHGVIYFSFGTLVDPSSITDSDHSAFYQAFEELPQQILWRCKEREMRKLPRNVKCMEWTPQLSILCHPNVRLFITHGGMLGTQEAIYCGVPTLGLPLFGDQYVNIASAVAKGFALEVNFRRLTYEQLSSALRELLTNRSYTENAKRASARFRDRPIKPIDEAVYWIEYIIRHGANSLKTAAQEMPWYQYYLIDVLLTIAAIIFLTLYAIYKISKLLFRGENPNRSRRERKIQSTRT